MSDAPSWVPEVKQLPTMPAPIVTPMDPQRALRDGLHANNDLIVGFMRSIAPPAPPIDGGVTGTYSTPAESLARTERYRFSVVAVVLICAVIAGGVVLLAYRWGAVDSLAGVAGWLALTGVLSAGFVTWLQTQDFQHSAEGIALAREGYRAVVDQMDAETRAALAGAYVYAIEAEADAKAAQIAMQGRALDAEVQRLMLAAPAPAPRHVARHYAIADLSEPVVDPVETPVVTPVVTPVTPPVDPAAAAVLNWVAGLYDDEGAIQPQTRRVLREYPWSARSAVLSPADKTRVRAAILGMEPPLFVPLAGNGLALPCPFKALALRRVRTVL